MLFSRLDVKCHHRLHSSALWLQPISQSRPHDTPNRSFRSNIAMENASPHTHALTLISLERFDLIILA